METPIDYKVSVAGMTATDMNREEAPSEASKGRSIWVCWEWGVPQQPSSLQLLGRDILEHPRGVPGLGRERRFQAGLIEPSEGRGDAEFSLSVDPFSPSVYQLVPWGWVERQRSRNERAIAEYQHSAGQF